MSGMLIGEAIFALLHIDKRMMDHTIAKEKVADSAKKLAGVKVRVNALRSKINTPGVLSTNDVESLFAEKKNIQAHLSNLSTAEKSVRTFEKAFGGYFHGGIRIPETLAQIKSLRMQYEALEKSLPVRSKV